MSSDRNKILAFNDRWFLIIGIPVITIFIQVIFFKSPLFTSGLAGLQEFFEGSIYTTAFWLCNVSMMIYHRKKYPEFEQNKIRLIRQFIFVLISTPIIGGIVALLMYFIYHFTPLNDLSNPPYFITLFSVYFICISITSIYEVIYFFDKYRQTLLERNELQLANVQGQLDHLRSQINPHFLFNSLNTLMNLIPMDKDHAMSYLGKLAKFYRNAVNQQDQLITLTKELDHLGIYIDLLKERFQNGLIVDYPNAPANRYQIPPMSLQLLIENAVKHNIISSKKPLYIKLEVEEGTISVKNNKQLKIRAPESTGMGLTNTKKRFELLTNEDIKIIDGDSCFEVILPLIHHDK